MKIKKILLSVSVILFLSVLTFSQDVRTVDTKIADLLSQLPASNLQYTNKLLGDMITLGEEGLKKICNQIIPAGTGDDTKPRFALESFSRFLSQNGNEKERSVWEKICIAYAIQNKDAGVKDFFMKQLQLCGGDQTAEALAVYLSDKENCAPAIAVISAAGGKTAEHVLAESLRSRDLPCPAAVMNALALIKSQQAVNEYIIWSSDENINIKASAYNALARSGHRLAYPVLLKAAKSFSYRWESTGATAALLNYAKNVGLNGDLKTMDKICKLLISECNDKQTYQIKTAALETYVSFHGVGAMPVILKAAAHPEKKYRVAAINMSASIKGDQVIDKWIKYYPRAINAAKPDIISMLGNHGDKKALNLITSSLNDPDGLIRSAAAEAVAKIDGKNSASSLIGYLTKFDNAADQKAATSAFRSIAGNEEISLLKPVLKDGSPSVKKSVIELIAWKKGQEYFSEILPYTSSDDESVRSAAFKALPDLAGPDDQNALITLLLNTNDPVYVSDLQSALVNAANKINDSENKSSVILKALDMMTGKEKLIPVLAKTGGRKALAFVMNEFENGNPEMREVCFKALSSWNDYSASSALYEICASANKNYEAAAFKGYVKQVKSAVITDEQKLLLFRKIMSYALSAERKNEILTELGRLKTYQSLFFVAGYLDDPATSGTAAQAAMKIALPFVSSGTGMSGKLVRDILLKAVPKLSGSESEYDKEMVNKYLASMSADEGFVSMFNGKDLAGWQGLVENPVTRSKMKPDELARKQVEANKKVPLNWSVKDGCIWFNGKGENLCSIKEYGDFEMLADWKITKEGDSGIYLRGSPQVQIWDTSRVSAGAQVGSGGLYNNKINPSKPLKVADNQVGEWNTFRIIMIGEKVSVWLNGELVVDNVIMENYWDRSIPIFPKGAIELQAHGTDLAFRDLYVREISEKDYNLTPESPRAHWLRRARKLGSPWLATGLASIKHKSPIWGSKIPRSWLRGSSIL